jgi:hypothetical protein
MDNPQTEAALGTRDVRENRIDNPQTETALGTRVSFVDIAGIAYYHCLSFLFVNN